MSVQTQINRISGAVSDALAALTAKGVTVPDGTKVDGLADLIAEISVTEDLTAVLDEQELKLEELLLAIALKSAGEGATIETWEITLTDGSVIEKRVVVA